MKLIFWLFIAILIFKGCSDGDGNLNAGLESSTFNVYFYFPDGKEYYLGKSRGLSHCQSMARSYANERVARVLVDITGVIFAVFKQQIAAALKNINNHISCGL